MHRGRGEPAGIAPFRGGRCARNEGNMPFTRRVFGRVLVQAGALAAARQSAASSPRMIKAVAFDAFPILDPRPVFALAERLFPGNGARLTSLWRTRQFEYTWLRTLSLDTPISGE